MNRIATSPLTGRIFAGRINKAGDAFLEGKKDVTSDVLRAVVEKAQYHGGTFVIEAGDQAFTVTVVQTRKAAPVSIDPDPRCSACGCTDCNGECMGDGQMGG